MSGTQESRLEPKRRRALARDFDRTSRRIQTLLAERLGGEEASELAEQARREHEVLVEEIPHSLTLMAGARDATYAYLAYYKALARREWSAKEIGPLFLDSWDVPAAVKRMPRWLRLGMARLLLVYARRRLRREARLSAERRDPNDFVFEFVEPEPGETDLGIDITECAICKCFARHDAEEIVPYLCALDDKMSDRLQLGLRRSGTRALGSKCCDFRYRLGGTSRPLPVINT